MKYLTKISQLNESEGAKKFYERNVEHWSFTDFVDWGAREWGINSEKAWRIVDKKDFTTDSERKEFIAKMLTTTAGQKRLYSFRGY